MVVFTQNILCRIIPNINKTNKVIKNVIRKPVLKIHIIITANIKDAKMVNKKSINAISSNGILYECIPFLGFPNAFAYLHKVIYFTKKFNILV